MSDNKSYLLIGAVTMGAFGFITLAIALEGKRFTRYGREALLCAASFMIVTAGIRTLFVSGLIGVSTGRLMTGYAGVVFLTIMLELLILHRVERKTRHHPRLPHFSRARARDSH